MRLSWKSIRVECLGLAAVMATLPISEPALHSLYTIAPDRFARLVPTYLASALVASLAVALALTLRSAIGRRASTSRCTATVRVAMVACTLVGLAGPWATIWVDVPPATLAAFGAAAGIGATLELVAWGELYQVRCRENALLHVALSSALGGLLLNTLGTMPPVAACAIFAILQIVAVGIPVCLESDAMRPSSVRAAEHENSPASAPDAPSATIHALRPGWHALFPLGHAVAPLAGIALYGMSFSLLGMHGTLYLYLSFLLGAIVVGVALAALLFWKGEDPIVRATDTLGLPLAGLVALAFAVALPEGSQSILGRIALMVFVALVIVISLASLIHSSATEALAGSRSVGHKRSIPRTGATASQIAGPKEPGVKRRAGESLPSTAIPIAIATFATASLAGLWLQTSSTPDANARLFLVLALVYLGCVLMHDRLASAGTGRAPALHPASESPDAAPGNFEEDHVPSAPERWGALAAPAVTPGQPSLPIRGVDSSFARDFALTSREAEITCLLARGRSWTEIAEELVISESTARGHAHKVYQKVGVSTKEELLAFLAKRQKLPRTPQ